MGNQQLKQTFKYLFAAFLVFGAHTVFAKNQLLIEEGAFLSEWIDENWGGIALERSFHSRSLYSGIFGLGWCSNLDLSLKINDRTTELQSCFKKPTPIAAVFDEASRFWTVQLKDPRKDLQKDPLENQIYEFNQKGQLMSIRKSKLKIKISRDSQGRITNIEYLRKKLPVKYNSQNTVVQIGNNHYQYNGENQLSLVKNSWNSKFYYTYNFYNNLTEIKGPGKYLEQIEYDDDLDVVTKWTDKSGCTTQAEWLEKPSSRLSNLVSIEPEIKKECLL